MCVMDLSRCWKLRNYAESTARGGIFKVSAWDPGGALYIVLIQRMASSNVYP